MAGAGRLLGHLRRLHRTSAATPFSSPFRNPNPFSTPGLSGHHPRVLFFFFFHGRSPQTCSPWQQQFSNGFASWSDSAAASEDDGGGGGKIFPVDVFDGSGAVEVTASDDSLWYAPVRALISLLDGYHEITGLPWWIIIATSTLAARVSLLPVLILQFKKMGRFAQLFPKLPPPLPPPYSGKSFREQFLLFREKRLELGCPSYLWNFAFISVQIPCFLFGMTSIRRMSLDSHPGFDCGGVLWFQNLTECPHGFLGSVMPILIAGLHYINVQISFQTFKVAKLPGILGLLARYYKLYLDIISIPLLLIGFYVPQGSLVYWVTNSSFTLVQQLSLKNPHVRKILGLPEKNDAVEHKNSGRNHLREKNVQAEDQISTGLSPEGMLELALEHLARKDQDSALPLLRLATEKNPDLGRALIAMGQISCSRGLLVEAAEYFERAISKIKEEEVGDLILALVGAGISHQAQGRMTEAIEQLKRISELKEPEDPVAKATYYQGLGMLGSFLYNEGKKSEAAKYLRIVATYDPGFYRYLQDCEKE